jgi:hypothetical protein
MTPESELNERDIIPRETIMAMTANDQGPKTLAEWLAATSLGRERSKETWPFINDQAKGHREVA